MTFLQPWWWALALLAVPLVLWHGRRRRTLTVPSLRAWRDAAGSHAETRRRFRPPRVGPSLLLQLLALLALVLALVGPRPAGADADHVVLVVDRSASMGAAHEDGTRLDAALARARAELRGLDPAARGGPRVSLASVGTEVRIEAADVADAAHVLGLLDELGAVGAPDAASWRRAARRVEGIVRPGEATRVIVVTDGAEADAARRAFGASDEDAPWRAEVLAFGDGVASAGLSAVHAVPIDGEAGRWRVEGEVVAFPVPTEPLTIDVRYAREGTDGELPWERLEVRPRGERTTFSFETRVPDAGVLALRLPGDALPADDVARVGLRREPVPLRVLVLGDAPEPLSRALAALDAAEVTIRAAEDGPVSEGAYDLAVVTGGATPAARPAAVVAWIGGAAPDGPHPRRPEEALAPVPRAGNGIVRAPTDVPDEAIGTAYDVPRIPGAAVLLDDARGPLLQAREEGGRTDLVAAWDLGATAWAREIGFAALVADLGRVARPRHGAWTSDRCIAGRACPSLAGGVAPPFPSEDPATSRATIVDGEAGPETDLREGGEAAAVPPRRAWPNRRTDRWLAAVAAAALTAEGLLAWRRARRHGRRASRRRRLARGARIAAVGCLVLLAAGAPTWLPRSDVRTVLVIDPWAWPADVLEEGEPWRAVRQAPAASRAVVLAEGDGRLLAGFGDAWDGDVPVRRPAVGHDRNAVLDLAEGLLGARGGRIVLAGLGFEQDPAHDRLARRLADREIAVDALVPPAPAAEEAWAEPVVAPEVVRTGERIAVHAAAAGPAAAERGVRVTVDGAEVERTHDAAESVEIEAGPAGSRVLRAAVAGDGAAGRADNDVATRRLEVLPAGRVALVLREGESAPALASWLSARGYEIERLRPQDLPYDVEGWLDVDVAALFDVPAVAMHRLQQEALEAWVREHGGGVLLAGARHAFGPGGYLRTPLEELSPLSARVPGERPKAAMAFVLDRSGSMQQTEGGVSRLAVAKEAAVAATELLHPESEVAVVVFDDVATTLAPLSPPGGLRDVLAPVVPGGGTNLYPALEAALEELRRSDAPARHVIVMTDGLAQPAPFDPLVDAIVAEGITVSTVAIGRGADRQMLQGMARRGGGAFHASDDVRALPGILSQEAMLLSGSPVREGVVRPEFEPGSAAFAQELSGAFPAVGGYVRTTAKVEADVHATTPEGDPILASWRHGVGRVVALTTPPVGPWAGTSLSMPFTMRLYDGALRWLVPPVAGPGVRIETARAEDALVVTATVVGADGTASEGARLDLVVASPEGAQRDAVPLAEVAPGRYRARVPAHESGEVRLTVLPVDARSLETLGREETLVHVDRPASLAPSAASARGPVALARATEGRILLEGRIERRPAGWRLVALPVGGPWALAAVALSVVGLALASASPRRGARRPMVRS